MKRFLLVLISFLLPLLAVRGEVPLKPANGIYDPEGWLEEDAVSEMAREISTAREKGGVKVFVAIFPEGGSTELNQVALEMGRKWGGDDLWGLLLHVVNDPASPQYFGEFIRETDWSEQQKTDFQASVLRALSEAERKAKLSADPRSQVASGTRLLSEELGYLGLVMERIERNNAQARGDRNPEAGSVPEAGQGVALGPQSIFLLVIGVLIVISVFVFFRLKKEEDREMEYYFPETSPRKRFLGPWSGGGNVLVQFNVTNENSGHRKDERRF